MSFRSSPIYKSYLKTTVLCAACTLAALALMSMALRSLPGAVGLALAGLGVLAAVAAAVGTCAGLVILARMRRSARGQKDLYLELNGSRTPEAVQQGRLVGASGLRRWLAARLLGHELVVGDQVEVRSWEEIRATLDANGCLEGLPFMPEMLALCGQRAWVYRSTHRIFDYRKTRRMRHLHGAVLLSGAVCSGARHGGCEAACLTIWKAVWLRRVGASGAAPVPVSAAGADTNLIEAGSQAPHYSCQLTQLQAASRPIGEWSPINFVRPLVSGNVAPAAFAVGWLTHLFNRIQHLRQGVPFPEFEPAMAGPGTSGATSLRAGDWVVVRSSTEIRATLNAQSLNRGLYFEPDMLKHSGHRYAVKAEIRSIIDIVTGEMRQMKTPAYLLDDLRFSGERHLFNAQHEPLFWRAVWLHRDGD